MATIHIPHLGDVDGVIHEGEPLPRPYVVLNDGTVMTYSEWMSKGNPA